MEIKITFSTIIGVLMVVIVTIAAIAILSTLTKVSVGECMPAEYPAARGYGGLSCGTDSLGRQLSCQYVIFDGFRLSDTCLDSDRNLCCPIFSEQSQYIASADRRGEACGKDFMGTQLRCDANDRCIDNVNNICSPQEIRIIEDKCCRIATI
jgi:hypothetical protein